MSRYLMIYDIIICNIRNVSHHFKMQVFLQLQLSLWFAEFC